MWSKDTNVPANSLECDIRLLLWLYTEHFSCAEHQQVAPKLLPLDQKVPTVMQSFGAAETAWVHFIPGRGGERLLPCLVEGHGLNRALITDWITSALQCHGQALCLICPEALLALPGSANGGCVCGGGGGFEEASTLAACQAVRARCMSMCTPARELVPPCRHRAWREVHFAAIEWPLSGGRAHNLIELIKHNGTWSRLPRRRPLAALWCLWLNDHLSFSS